MISAASNSTLSTILANATYGSGSGIHGLALSSENAFLYSADDIGNALWVYAVNGTAGRVEEVQYLAATTGADPRRMGVHSTGGSAYVIFEGLSQLGVYERDVARGELRYTNTTFSLLPSIKS
jgi:carboxy-cis,cis-muconate cyclase